MDPPREAAHADFAARLDQSVVRESFALLSGRNEREFVLVPAGDGVCVAGRDVDRGAERPLQFRVAAAVVGVQVRVDDARQRSSLQRVPHQFPRLLLVRDVAGVDEGRAAVVVEQQHVVGRQPSALEHADRRREGSGHRTPAQSMRPPAARNSNEPAGKPRSRARPARLPSCRLQLTTAGEVGPHGALRAIVHAAPARDLVDRPVAPVAPSGARVHPAHGDARRRHG